MGIKYKQTINLNEDELAAKVNANTGEVTIVEEKEFISYPKGKQTFGKEETEWKKSFTPSWEFLETVLTDLELRVTMKLCRLAKTNTNSLEPLNDEIAIASIAKEFNIGRNKVTPLFKKLFHYGVYAQFEAYKPDIPYTKYWILNPYLSFGGGLINSDIMLLFKGTILEKEYTKRIKKTKIRKF